MAIRAAWRPTCGGRAYSGWVSGIRSWISGTKGAPARRSAAIGPCRSSERCETSRKTLARPGGRLAPAGRRGAPAGRPRGPAPPGAAALRPGPAAARPGRLPTRLERIEQARRRVPGRAAKQPPGALRGEGAFAVRAGEPAARIGHLHPLDPRGRGAVHAEEEARNVQDDVHDGSGLSPLRRSGCGSNRNPCVNRPRSQKRVRLRRWSIIAGAS